MYRLSHMHVVYVHTPDMYAHGTFEYIAGAQAERLTSRRFSGRRCSCWLQSQAKGLPCLRASPVWDKPTSPSPDFSSSQPRRRPTATAATPDGAGRPSCPSAYLPIHLTCLIAQDSHMFRTLSICNSSYVAGAPCSRTASVCCLCSPDAVGFMVGYKGKDPSKATAANATAKLGLCRMDARCSDELLALAPRCSRVPIRWL